MDPKKTTSKSKAKSKDNEFNCCDATFEKMFEKMQKFCGGKEKSFDCCEMMQHMINSEKQMSNNSKKST